MHKVYYVHFFNIMCVVFVVKFKKISLSYKIEDVGLLFTPMSITPLIDMEDARFVLNVSRPSP